MALNFTYEQFLEAAKKAGLENGFSAADMALAQKNPNAGMQILQYKIDYGKATTDEQRNAANKGAEGVRMQYGNYYGGVTGDEYYAAPNNIPTPTGNDASATSFGYSNYTQNSPYRAAAMNALANVQNIQPYQSQYADQIAGVTNQILNPEAFSYDKETDPLYNAYRKQYLREGQRATADTLGQAAANTGGIASSYAVNAANQAGNYYNSQLNDKLVDLYNAAYSRYTADIQNKYNQLGALRGLDSDAYNRYLGDVQNTYNQLGAVTEMDNTEYNRVIGDRNYNYQQERDAIEDAYRNQVFNYNAEMDARKLEASAAADEADRAWSREQFYGNQAFNAQQSALDRESKERMNAQDNASAYQRALLSQTQAGDDYLDMVRSAYPGGVTSIDEWKELVKEKGSAWLKKNNISIAPSAVNDYDTLQYYFQQKGMSTSGLLDRDTWELRKKQREYKNQPFYKDFDTYEQYINGMVELADEYKQENTKQSLGIED